MVPGCPRTTPKEAGHSGCIQDAYHQRGAWNLELRKRLIPRLVQCSTPGLTAASASAHATRRACGVLAQSSRSSAMSTTSSNAFPFLTPWRSRPSRFIPILASTRPEAGFLTRW